MGLRLQSLSVRYDSCYILDMQVCFFGSDTKDQMSLYDLFHVPFIVCQALLSGAKRLIHLMCHQCMPIHSFLILYS